MSKRIWLAIAAAALCGTAQAEYPDKQFTFIVPFAAGSATDQLARSLGQEVSRITKQTVVVDNKPGASGFIGANVVNHLVDGGTAPIVAVDHYPELRGRAGHPV